MLVHLRMSGRLDVVLRADALTKHARVVWLLDGGLALRFDDARKFGRVYLPERLDDVLGRIGPDALQIGEDAFVERLRAKKGKLKSVLLDQSFVAGVGNIYADESLHRAGLHPTRSAATVKPEAARRLFATVRDVLHEGIAANGASFDWVYPDGNFQENFRVYGQTGKSCDRCGALIKRIVVGQRSTHFCPKCQK
jgi:formamidopyrimidine-DNA glycosylase